MTTDMKFQTVMIPPLPDHEGVDEWWVGVFDGKQDQSDPLYETQGTFALCVQRASDFSTTQPEMELRVVIERVC